MAPHSSTLAWKIPWTEEPGRLQSTGSQRVGHDWATSLSLFTFINWRRKWQPTPVFLPGESQGWRSLVGCRLWGCTELDTTEATLAAAAPSFRGIHCHECFHRVFLSTLSVDKEELVKADITAKSKTISHTNQSAVQVCLETAPPLALAGWSVRVSVAFLFLGSEMRMLRLLQHRHPLTQPGSGILSDGPNQTTGLFSGTKTLRCTTSWGPARVC